MAEQRSCTILLVEDEAIIAAAQRLTLEKEGYQVVVATSPAKALSAAEQPQLDLVLMDIDLGAEMDGTEVAQRVLQDREIPIVFLTSHSEKHIVERVKGITRYGYVLKSSGSFVLIETIEMALNLFRSYRQRAADESRYRTLFDSADNPIVIYDQDARMVEANAVVRRGLNRTPDQIHGTELREVIPEAHDKTVERIRECIDSGQRAEYVDTAPSPSGAAGWYRSVFQRLPKGADGRHLVQVSSRDITTLVELEEQVQAGTGKEFAIAITEVAPILMYAYDRELGRNIWANRSYQDTVLGLTGKHAHELDRDTIFGLFHPEDRGLLTRRDQAWASSGPSPADELQIRLGNGSDWRWFLHRSAILERDEQGYPTKTIGFMVDIDSQKRAESELRRVVEENEALRRELHHRVTNNLQTVKSLVQMKSSELGVDLSDLDSQVTAISLLHRLLTPAGSGDKIVLRDYFLGIVDGVVTPGGLADVTISIDVPDMEISSKPANLLGLIVSEAAQNAFKHAFSTGEGHFFHIRLNAEEGAQMWSLCFSDSGPGFPAEVDFDSATSTGLQLLSLLAGQLNGEISILRPPHTELCVTFPDPRRG